MYVIEHYLGSRLVDSLYEEFDTYMHALAWLKESFQDDKYSFIDSHTMIVGIHKYKIVRSH